ncbi:S8 family peptidase [Streptomyces sp. Li-HN-5-11]|uniref:S8 family peptidase n=1 Tax=Streptomyces sp. Li-HN-5-11 TaxID=3075432 RepID=UPI0028A8B48C|nr:S8 family peptidase [Streptomyces sp. Li-HN-5-11]WNM35761.1 S8 family peptidase [Streptomyces sp. Li-HN-5-11]
MSQQYSGRRPGRRSTFLLVPALVAGLALAQGAPVAAAPDQPDQNTFSAGTYLVQLHDRPVATYSKTAPAPGKRLSPRSQAVRDYLGHLKREREEVLDEVKGVRPALVYQYALNGFAAKLTDRQAAELARTPGVVSVVRNEMLQPAAAAGTSGAATAATTTATGGSLPAPDTAAFLGLKERAGLYSQIPGGQRRAGEGLIIGVLDTGIDTNNPSLRALPDPRPDAEVIAKKWKGGCDRGEDTEHQVTCNNKVIGAQYFRAGLDDPQDTDWASPMDADSHGTHTATTAAGNIDVSATVPDSGISGRISGLAPAARIAAYKVCWSGGCPNVDIIAGFDKAVADGVDVINYSIGGANGDATTEPVYQAMFNAARAGVFVSTSANNNGPGTVSNNVPWVATVAASSHDTGYRTTVTLGNGKSFDGVGISALAVNSAPLVDAEKAARRGVDAAQAELCKPDTLDARKLKGAIVLCKRGDNARIDKSAQVNAAGGVGMVLYNANATDEEIADAHTVPSVHVDSTSGRAIKAYADSTAGATAALGAARAVKQPGAQIAGFSSGGPDLTSGGDLIKPDMAAPGVDIVAGTVPGSPEFKGEQGMMSGTSMAAPHVAGLALLLRQLHPDWSPMEVKSSLMTTATTKDSEGKPIRRAGADSPATPLDYGAGQVVPNRAADPGLVYDSTSADWIAYSCSLGEHPVAADGSDACVTARKIDPSDFNSPTLSVGDLLWRQTVTRTVTNIGRTTGVYTATLQTPPGYKATVSPKRLVVPAGGSASYRVTFTRTSAAFGDWSYGSVTWSDKHHKVRSAIALRATPMRAPDEATGNGATGSVTLTPRNGYRGTLATTVNGLYAGTTRTGTLTGDDPDFSAAPLPPSVAEMKVTVPEGTTLARLAIQSRDFLPGSDIDLVVFDADGNLLSTPGEGSDEHVDLPGPGTYDVYLSQYALPPGATSQKYTLHTWLIGADTKPDHPATATPAEQQAEPGAAAKVTVSWRNLPAGRTYLGLVDYGDGKDTFASTVLTVTP